MSMYRTLTATCISFFVLSCSNETAVEAPADGQPLSNAEMRVIYGEDNRLDRYQVTGVVAQLADSTVALMNASSVSWNGSGYNLYVGQSYAEAYSPLCFDEPFREQPATAWCSGFPVGPDLIATAGHCVDSSTCAIGGGQAAFVFGYHMLSATGVQSTVGADDVYFCEQVVQRVENTVEDWAVVKLTRNLVGHTPLNFRRLDGVDRVPTGTPVLVSGHPMGLPVKIAGGATVKNNSNGAYFDSNLDTYGGNSGSPVVNADRLANNEIFVEGILVRGATDLTVSGGCYTSNTCSDTVGCSGDGTFEDVTRTYLFADLVTVCGNGVREGAEACDGDDLGLASCASLGCTGGGVTCSATCTLDLSTCTECPVCDNDGLCETGESCESCPNDCESVSSGSAVCGNGICEIGNNENCSNCSQDCAGRLNGKPSNRYCCGQDTGCSDNRCTASSQCTEIPVSGNTTCCGDGACDSGETITSCAIDCACQDDAACDDGNPCTIDSCTNGACENTPLDCDDGNACTDDTCENGLCENVTVTCNDGNPCTTDSCSPTTGCTYVDNGSCPSCLNFGSSCSTNSDCCSGNCHWKKKTCK